VDAVTAALFVIAAIGCWFRLSLSNGALDRALPAAALCSVAAELAMGQSLSPYDAAAALAYVLNLATCAILLGGSLRDNLRLFDQVNHLAASDALTGLANYRRLLE
jgi:hypothetical protein